MKVQVRSFLLALAVTGAAAVTPAQNAAPAKADVDRCTDWLKTLVPDKMRVDVGPFCAGLKQEQDPNLGGWVSTFHCGPASKTSEEGKGPYCTSSGEMNPFFSVALGFKAESGDGGDFMPSANGDPGKPATLFTRTPMHMGKLRLPAGLYRFALARTADKWQMVVSRETGDQVGVVPLQADDQVSYTGSGLSLAVHHSGFHCADPVNVHELIFTYNGQDLHTCFQADRVAPTGRDVAAN